MSLYQTAAVAYIWVKAHGMRYRGKSEHWPAGYRVSDHMYAQACMRAGRKVAGNARPVQAARCEQRRVLWKRSTDSSAVRSADQSDRDVSNDVDVRVQRLNPYPGARPCPSGATQVVTDGSAA